MYWRLPTAVLIIFFINVVFVHGSTIIVAYSDFNCKTTINTYTETDYIPCYPLPSAGSVSVIVQETYCPVSVYSDANCSFSAKLADLNTCTSPYPVKSYSIDCQYPTSTSKAPSTAIAAPAPATSVPSPVVHSMLFQATAQTPSPSPSTTLAQDVAKPQGLQSRSTVLTTPRQLTSLFPSSTLISTTSTQSPLDNLNSNTTDLTLLVDTVSPTLVLPTQAPSGTLSTGDATNTGTSSSDKSSNNGLSVPVQIFLATFFPVLGIIGTVIFGINQWRREEERLRKRQQRWHDDIISMITGPQGGASISVYEPSARTI